MRYHFNYSNYVKSILDYVRLKRYIIARFLFSSFFFSFSSIRFSALVIPIERLEEDRRALGLGHDL